MTMNHIRLTALSLAVSIGMPGFGQTADSEGLARIAIWGSSVAVGIGDESQAGGFSGRLRELIPTRHMEVLDLSRPGDNITKIVSRFQPEADREANMRYLVDVDPDYVVIALSLGNEGIAQCQLGQTAGCTSNPEQAEKVFDKFAMGLQNLVARVRATGARPVVTLPYARLDYSEREYALTRRMNLLINTWDVPSVNLLGALDDGQGRWARGTWADPFHPNAAGYTEMAHAFVPTLFAAMESGKAAPQRSVGPGHAHVRRNGIAPLVLTSAGTMRSFSMTFQVRVREDGVVASIGGQALSPSYLPYRRSYGDFEWDTESLVFPPVGGRFVNTMAVADGRLSYRSVDGHELRSASTIGDGWHWVTLTHYVVRGETLLYVDGELVGTLDERLQPDSFVLGGPESRIKGAKAAAADYKDWLVHRAGLTGDEVVALHQGLLLQASLELYAPLNTDGRNVAQSLSTLAVNASEVSFRG